MIADCIIMARLCWWCMEVNDKILELVTVIVSNIRDNEKYVLGTSGFKYEMDSAAYTKALNMGKELSDNFGWSEALYSGLYKVMVAYADAFMIFGLWSSDYYFMYNGKGVEIISGE